MARILIVDDKASMRAMLVRLFTSEGHAVDQAADGLAGLERLTAEVFDLVITDSRMPGADGATVLRSARALDPPPEVIVMTAFATVDAAVDAVKNGAYDYVSKPFEPDEMLLKVNRALERSALRARAQSAEAALRAREASDMMVGRSPALERARFLIHRVADLDVTVLLTGESGSGKEVAARLIHSAGARRDLPFVAVNCGAIPAHLMESELFGHTKGAFTGAVNDRPGLMEGAGKGTLFLDEIGDLPLELQVKLNRALEQRRFRRVGEQRERPLEARVIAATHRDLKAGGAAGTFREDLYFRLAVYPIALPPLRDRGDDVLLLAHHALTVANKRFGTSITSFSPEALRGIQAYRWPGNARELMHAVERAAILAASETIELRDMPDELSVDLRLPTASESTRLLDLPYKAAMKCAAEEAKRDYLTRLLTAHDGHITVAAEAAGIERESLHRLLRQAGVDAADYRVR